MFQTIKTEDFETLFCVLEDTIKIATISDEKDLMPILRISNSILDKLSATSHTGFIGRIHKLIIDVSPCSHKSGVNFKGLYNERVQMSASDDMDVDNNQTEDTADNPLSYEFFKNFWVLQKYVSSPFKV